MVSNIFKFFTPKDRVFYSLFEEIVGIVFKMAETLKKVVYEPDFDKRSALISEVEHMEHLNDEMTHKVFTELGRNFITPFDREDIHYLASALDDIADYIYASAKKINFYRVNPNEQGIHKMAELILASTEQIKNAVMELRSMKNMWMITEALVKVNSIENQADDIYDLSIDHLFQAENDVKEVIKKREIYQALEKATDKCEDAADVIESIIIKYA
ncbi:MAG: DUF47 domain-containing protein [Bacteroidetes bacterium]|nr:DUF47 domain-containing protein [Bacteroidota bacterium]